MQIAAGTEKAITIIVHRDRDRPGRVGIDLGSDIPERV